MTERAKKLLLLYCKQGGKIRRVSGLPLLTFKAKKAGTLKNYRIYGNTETKTRSYSGSAPLSFPIVDGAVSNYRVYGQTSRNLFDETIYNKNVADNTIIYVPMYVGNVDYVTCSTTCPKTGDNAYDGNNSRYIFFISGSVDAGAQNTANGVSNGVPRTIPATNGYVTIAYRKIEKYNVRPWEYQTMLNVGSTALPYEPYGESVGDKTGNILPMSTTPIDTIIDDFHCEYDGMGTIKLIALTNNAILSDFTVPLSKDFTIPVSVGQGGTGCWQINNDAAYMNAGYIASFSLNLKKNTYTQDYWRLSEINRINSNYTSMGGANINAIQIQTNPDAATNIRSGQTLTIRPAFVENVTEQVPFEPYGKYKIPLTNNSENANIYLDEPLRKVGDEAEYVDFEEQKQHRVRKNLLENTAKSQTINGVTFTVNSDGSVTCNGKCVNNVAVLYIKRPTTFYDETIQYTLTGCPVGGVYKSTYALEYTNSIDQSKPDVGNGVSFTPYRKEFYPNACIRIVIFVGYTCDNLTFYPMIRKADIEDDTYEPYIENTEVDVTLPALPAQSSSNSLSVGTTVQPSSVAVDVSEVVSCGDKTENLFDFGEWSKNINANVDNSLAKGIDGITITANSNDAFTAPYAYVHEGVYKIYVKPNTNYLLSWVSNNNLFGRVFVFKNGVVDGSHMINVNNAEKNYLLFDTDTNTEFVTLRFGVNNAGNSITYSKIMLIEGSTALPYEPYGYKVPVKVEGINILPMSTTPISTDVDDFHCEYDGAGTITLTTDKDNAVLSGFSIPLSEDFIIPVSVGQGGDGCAQFNNSIATSVNSNTDHICVNFFYNMTFIDSYDLTTINRRHSMYSSMGGKTINRVVIDIKGTGFSTNRKIVIRPAFILNTTEQVSFEPYHAPVTTPIYLPEQIKKVGEEAEYVDYATQKWHRVGKNLFDENGEVTDTYIKADGTTSIGSSGDRFICNRINVIPNTEYTFSWQQMVLGTSNNSPYIRVSSYDDNNNFIIRELIQASQWLNKIYTITTANNVAYLDIRMDDTSSTRGQHFEEVMLNVGPTALPYEPYIEDTEVDVTLPEIAVTAGTNTLTVGTEVQPSSVEIKGRIKAAGGD